MAAAISDIPEGFNPETDGVNQGAEKMDEESTLLNLHALLSCKQHSQGDSVDSDPESEDGKVITESQGNFKSLRGLFSPNYNSGEPVNGHEDKSAKSMECDNQASAHEPCNGSASESATGVNVISEPKPTKQTANHDDLEHDNVSNTLKEENSLKLSQPSAVNTANKKRKLTPSPPAMVQQNKENTVFPVFRKSGTETTVKTSKDGRQKEKRVVVGKHANKKKPQGKDCISEESIETLLSVNEENLQVLDVRTVCEMFRRMKKDIQDLKEEQVEQLKMAKINVEKTIGDTKISIERDVNTSIKDQQKEIDELQDKIKQLNFKNQILIGAFQQSQEIVQDMADRLDTIELNNAKKAAILSGLHFSETKKDRMAEIQHFLETGLGINVDVDDSYLLGDSRPRQCVIIFSSVAHKNRAFEVKSELRHLEAEDGAQIYLNSYLPAAVNEKKARERDIIADMKETSPKTNIEHTAKGLKIGAEVYQKQVTAPKPADLLDLDADELNRILALDCTKGQTLFVQGNMFTPLAADVRSHGEIRDLYMKIRIMFARAKHVVCAYMLPSGPTYRTQDYVDDGDFGAGRALLRYMQTNKIYNKVIFIVRMCSRVKLGKTRFESYVHAAFQVMKQNPYNSVLSVAQDYQQVTQVKPPRKDKRSSANEGNHTVKKTFRFQKATRGRRETAGKQDRRTWKEIQRASKGELSIEKNEETLD